MLKGFKNLPNCTLLKQYLSVCWFLYCCMFPWVGTKYLIGEDSLLHRLMVSQKIFSNRTSVKVSIKKKKKHYIWKTGIMMLTARGKERPVALPGTKAFRMHYENSLLFPFQLKFWVHRAWLLVLLSDWDSGQEVCSCRWPADLLPVSCTHNLTDTTLHVIGEILRNKHFAFGLLFWNGNK